MKRLVIPGGETVEVRTGIFTVTAYDPVAGKLIGMGHALPPGSDRGLAGGPIKKTYLAFTEDRLEQSKQGERIVGTVTGWSRNGIVGDCVEIPDREAVLTAKPDPGPGTLRFVCLEGGETAAEILEVSGEKFVFKADAAVAQGMSGAPILQKGRLVGAVIGMDYKKRLIGVSAEAMADDLLDPAAERRRDEARRRALGRRKKGAGT